MGMNLINFISFVYTDNVRQSPLVHFRPIGVLHIPQLKERIILVKGLTSQAVWIFRENNAIPPLPPISMLAPSMLPPNLAWHRDSTACHDVAHTLQKKDDYDTKCNELAK